MTADADTCDLLCIDLPKAERVRKGLPSAEGLELLAAGAKALGDPTRLAIALALRPGSLPASATSPGSPAATSASSPTTFACSRPLAWLAPSATARWSSTS